MERVLSSAAFTPLIASFGRERVKGAVSAHLATLRIGRNHWSEAEALSSVGAMLASSLSSSLRHVVNATGVIIHTNLGRSPISREIWDSAATLAGGYSNLEFDLSTGERGRRDEHLSGVCRELFGCEAAVLTNNNAAATLLLLAATSAGREVLVSRGELVEIGGAFRVPDVIQQGGARLAEVGTTNRTRASDYAEAARRKTAAILRVHRSNFDIVGFTETPSIADLVEVARAKKLPLLYDEGSGRVVPLDRYGFSRGETIAELLSAGVDAISCSTDKLIGATQGGLILGREEIVAKCRKHPLMRALRAGKESYAIIGETLRAFATGQHEERIPVYSMLAASGESLERLGRELIDGTGCRLVETRAVLGGGTTPTETVPSLAIEVAGRAAEQHARFLAMPVPVVGRIEDDRLLLDLRTILAGDVDTVKSALSAANE